MRCSKCGSENPAGKKFCEDCGAPLENRCPKCGAETTAGKRFCGDCGTALIANTSAPSQASSSITPVIAISAEQAGSAVPDGERKTVTALFADIKGSMELMEDLDPEEARAIVDPALKLMIDAVRRYDGYIVQSTGDGIFALFGAPVAHEDHPQRALYAALRMQEEMRRFAERLRAEKGLNLQVRVGANVGDVVVRSIQTGEKQVEYTPIGHSISLASRLQTLANPGSIAISDGLRKLVEGYFTHKALGPARIKGSSEAVSVYEIAGLGPLRTRLQRAAGRGLTKFVGREREMEVLRHAAELAREGRGQIVAAMADPGVGKSRLFYEFKATSASGWMVLEALSISHGKASAYLPVIDLLRNYFEISAADDERKRREKVAGKIAILDRSLEDSLPYLFSLLGIVEGDDPLAQMDGQLKKRRTLEAIKRILLRESLKQPLMVVFEDLHWMDGESELLLNLLADSIGTSRVLLMVNYRPEYHHQWGSKTYYTQLRLDPLGKESADEMLSTLLGSDESLAPLKRLIAEKTEGNPLFIEEIVLSLFEDSTLARNGEVKLAKPLASLRIPPTVQGILASRIDRLPAEEKDLLQTVAVIGAEFNLGVVRAITGKSDDELNRMLNDLQLAEFIYEQPAPGDVDAEYIFKHALTQQVVYSSILLERRRQIHEQAAQGIEALYATILPDHYADLARHYVRSGNAPKAINFLHLASQQALSRSAYQEASNQLTAALELLGKQVESAERDRTEIALVLDLAMGVEEATTILSLLERALRLSDKIGDDSNRLKSLEFLAYKYSILPDQLTRSRALNIELLASSERVQDLERAGWARSRLAWLSMHEGDFRAALQELDEVYQLSAIASLPYRVRPINWRIHGRAFGSFALWVSGYPARAVARAREAFAVARDVRAAAADRIFACWWSGYLNLLLREFNTARGFSEECATLIAQHGLPKLGIALVPLEAWIFVQLGQIDAGLSRMLRYKTDVIEPGNVFVSWLFVALANAYLAGDRVSEGIDAADEGLALCRSSGVRMLESELHRLKGELLLSSGSHEAAVQSFRDAIELARLQSAKSWELRAATSLARLLRDMGYRDEARSMLAEIYNWFTEGFDTADLKEAKALLDELAT
jgi:class 3 adenylate cyclase/tetratricopeptide (TPR) repeat protein